MPENISTLQTMASEPQATEQPVCKDSSVHELSAKAVSLRLSGKLLLDDINLSLCNSGITAILGYNGAGKSLLLRVLHGLINPSEGAVLWNGEPLNHKQRQRQAMVFQKPVMLRRNIIDNMRFVLKSRDIPTDEIDNRAQQLLERTGLETLAKQAARRLSGGEQQRLALARALAVQPLILFLDEATANLDPASTRWIEAVVADVAASGTKVVMVSHDLAQVRRLADEVVYIENGKICAQQSCVDIFEQPSTLTDSTANNVARFLRGELPVAVSPPAAP